MHPWPAEVASLPTSHPLRAYGEIVLIRIVVHSFRILLFLDCSDRIWDILWVVGNGGLGLWLASMSMECGWVFSCCSSSCNAVLDHFAACVVSWASLTCVLILLVWFIVVAKVHSNVRFDLKQTEMKSKTGFVAADPCSNATFLSVFKV